ISTDTTTKRATCPRPTCRRGEPTTSPPPTAWSSASQNGSSTGEAASRRRTGGKKDDGNRTTKPPGKRADARRSVLKASGEAVGLPTGINASIHAHHHLRVFGQNLLTNTAAPPSDRISG